MLVWQFALEFIQKVFPHWHISDITQAECSDIFGFNWIVHIKINHIWRNSLNLDHFYDQANKCTISTSLLHLRLLSLRHILLFCYQDNLDWIIMNGPRSPKKLYSWMKLELGLYRPSQMLLSQYLDFVKGRKEDRRLAPKCSHWNVIYRGNIKMVPFVKK